MTKMLSAPSAENNKRNVVLYAQGDMQFSPSWFFEDVTDQNTKETTRVLRVKSMPVFRSGSFKDSMGDISTWESIHIEQMKSSFEFLRANAGFTDVPVREGHGSFFGDPMTGLVGYHDALTTRDAVAPDGNTYRYLLADFSIYKEEHQRNFLSGLWKNRSSEVGYYETNDGTGYWPVYQGFAFVDIPAVQYLNLFGKNKQRSFSILLEREFSMQPESGNAPETPPTQNPDGSPAPNADPEPSTNPEPSTDPAPNTDPVTPPAPPTEPAPNTDPATPPVEPAQFNKNGGTVYFNCGGQNLSDFAQVQAYITKIETENASHLAFRSEATKLARTSYVKQLATDGKIVAAMVDDLIEDALSRTDEQFEKFRSMYDKAPALSLFQRHAQAGGVIPGEDEISADEKEYRAACDRVAWHRQAGTLESDLIETESYKTMTRLATKLGKAQV